MREIETRDTYFYSGKNLRQRFDKVKYLLILFSKFIPNYKQLTILIFFQKFYLRLLL